MNEPLKLEPGAVNQYWLHYRLPDDRGFGKLAQKEREESVDKMQHADKLMARILFPGGHPNMQSIEDLSIGINLKEVPEADLSGEHAARASCKKAARSVMLKVITSP